MQERVCTFRLRLSITEDTLGTSGARESRAKMCHSLGSAECGETHYFSSAQLSLYVLYGDYFKMDLIYVPTKTNVCHFFALRGCM